MHHADVVPPPLVTTAAPPFLARLLLEQPGTTLAACPPACRAGTAVVFLSLYYQTATKKTKPKSSPKDPEAPGAAQAEDQPLLKPATAGAS